MANTDDLLTMVYWVLGILIVMFIIDWFWLKPFQEYKQTDRIIQRLRQKNRVFYQTFPKYHPGRGIVTVIDDTNVLHGALLIVTLRRLLCKLPILVCYIADSLEDQNKKFLETLPNVACMELSSKLDMPVETIRGPQARVYSLIYSPFEEVMLLEPDLLFLKNPEYLFQDTLYRQSGTLFWKDRKLKSYWDKKVFDWVRRFIPYRKGDNQILDKKSGNYQSKDILLLNKSTHKKLLEKLWVLTKEWEIVYNYLPGDKESYWMAAELAKEDYAFVDHYPGIIGEVGMDTVCGHTLYTDSTGGMLCWNGSIFHNGDIRHVTDFTHFALFSHNSEWNKVFGTTDLNSCLKNAEIHEIPNQYLVLINDYARILHEIKNQLLVKITEEGPEEYDSDSDYEVED